MQVATAEVAFQLAECDICVRRGLQNKLNFYPLDTISQETMYSACKESSTAAQVHL